MSKTSFDRSHKHRNSIPIPVIEQEGEEDDDNEDDKADDNIIKEPSKEATEDRFVSDWAEQVAAERESAPFVAAHQLEQQQQQHYHHPVASVDNFNHNERHLLDTLPSSRTCDRRLSRAARTILQQALSHAMESTTSTTAKAVKPDRSWWRWLVSSPSSARVHDRADDETTTTVWQWVDQAMVMAGQSAPPLHTLNGVDESIHFNNRTPTTAATFPDTAALACPLLPARDMYLQHEQASLRVPAQWIQVRKVASYALPMKPPRRSNTKPAVGYSGLPSLSSSSSQPEAASWWYQCAICAKTFSSRYYLDLHFQHHHSTPTSPSNHLREHDTSTTKTTISTICPATDWCGVWIPTWTCHEVAAFTEPYYDRGSAGIGPDRYTVSRKLQKQAAAARSPALCTQAHLEFMQANCLDMLDQCFGSAEAHLHHDGKDHASSRSYDSESPKEQNGNFVKRIQRELCYHPRLLHCPSRLQPGWWKVGSVQDGLNSLVSHGWPGTQSNLSPSWQEIHQQQHEWMHHSSISWYQVAGMLLVLMAILVYAFFALGLPYMSALKVKLPQQHRHPYSEKLKIIKNKSLSTAYIPTRASSRVQMATSHNPVSMATPSGLRYRRVAGGRDAAVAATATQFHHSPLHRASRLKISASPTPTKVDEAQQQQQQQRSRRNPILSSSPPLQTVASAQTTEQHASLLITKNPVWQAPSPGSTTTILTNDARVRVAAAATTKTTTDLDPHPYAATPLPQGHVASSYVWKEVRTPPPPPLAHRSVPTNTTAAASVGANPIQTTNGTTFPLPPPPRQSLHPPC